MVEAYKEGLSTTWRVRKYNLDDLYVRFLKIGERRITASGSATSPITRTLMIPHSSSRGGVYPQNFDAVWIDCLNGDSCETDKLTPDGRPDPSIFSTPFNREGIRLGTAIGLFVRQQPHDDAAMPRVGYCNADAVKIRVHSISGILQNPLQDGEEWRENLP